MSTNSPEVTFQLKNMENKIITAMPGIQLSYTGQQSIR